jgi:phosphatidylserine/phosphatidylglycerophosphate/cardiolipin synthase-like enzyme
MLSKGLNVNRILRYSITAFCAAYSLMTVCQLQAATQSPDCDIEVYFSPRGGATAALLKQIEAARSTILVQAYSFTSSSIAEALLAAHRRGVRVEVILDSEKVADEKRSMADFLARAGVSVRLDAQHGTAHNKVMILDRQVVITGSYNFTRHSEEDNAENLLIIRNKAIADRYAANWTTHAGHSSVYRTGGARKDRKPRGN